MRFEDLPTYDDGTLENGWCDILPKGEYTRWDTTYYSGTYAAHDGGSVEDITPERIARVDAWFAESPDGYGSVDFGCLLELVDGSWAACMAWADTTGWDCQSGVEWKWALTREDAIAQGLDRSARAKLGVSLPGEEN